VLRLVENVGRAGATLRRPVGVCGEAASDPLLALVLVGLGVTSLSMAPACLPEVRASLIEHSYENCREMSTVALEAATAAEARARVADRARPSARSYV
jgi:phosphotransferase system enzyme I (PtsI)